MRHLARYAILCYALSLAAGAWAQQPAAGQPTPSPQAASFTFAVFGGSSVGAASNPVTTALATDLGEQRPAFVLGTGDYIGGALGEAELRGQYAAFFAAISPMQRYQAVPVAFAPGRAEAGRSSRSLAVFEELLGPARHSFDRHGCHFVVLNTEVPGQEGRIMGAQWEWLVQDLDHAVASKARHIFVVMHAPLFPVDGEIGQCLDRYPAYRDALHSLFVTRGVTAVFAGRERLFHSQRRDGVDYYITAGGGGTLAPTASASTGYHYLLVTVDEGGYRVTVRRIWPGWGTGG